MRLPQRPGSLHRRATLHDAKHTQSGVLPYKRASLMFAERYSNHQHHRSVQHLVYVEIVPCIRSCVDDDSRTAVCPLPDFKPWTVLVPT